MSNKTYLGDSVYAEYDPDVRAVTLTTENGVPFDPSNKIVLEDEVLAALDRFRATVGLQPSQPEPADFECQTHPMFREAIADASARRTRILNAATRFGVLYAQVADAMRGIEGCGTVEPCSIVGSLDVHISGPSSSLTEAVRVLRTRGFDWADSSDRPKEGDTSLNAKFVHPDGAACYLYFSSTVCRRVQVGTKTVEVPEYEVQCGDDVSIVQAVEAA